MIPTNAVPKVFSKVSMNYWQPHIPLNMNSKKSKTFVAKTLPRCCRNLAFFIKWEFFIWTTLSSHADFSWHSDLNIMNLVVESITLVCWNKWNSKRNCLFPVIANFGCGSDLIWNDTRKNVFYNKKNHSNTSKSLQ